MSYKVTMLTLLVWLFASAPAAAETGQGAGAMSVALFIAKAEALQAKGALALFSSDYGQLKAEVTGAAQMFRRQIKVEAAAGRPSACPPERAALTSDDILTHMRSYPVGVRPRITVAAAVADIFRKRFPCKAL